jgi:hypothetical protein
VPSEERYAGISEKAIPENRSSATGGGVYLYAQNCGSWHRPKKGAGEYPDRGTGSWLHHNPGYSAVEPGLRSEIFANMSDSNRLDFVDHINIRSRNKRQGPSFEHFEGATLYLFYTLLFLASLDFELNRFLAIEMRLPRVVPIAVIITSFVLAIVALVAGKHPRLEDFHIIVLNTTNLGKNLIQTPTSGRDDPSPTSCGPLKGALGELCASATAAAGSAVDSAISDLETAANDAADKLADKLGIHQWYSLHIINICQGAFTPNATAIGARYNVSGCIEPLKTSMSLYL